MTRFGCTNAAEDLRLSEFYLLRRSRRLPLSPVSPGIAFISRLLRCLAIGRPNASLQKMAHHTAAPALWDRFCTKRGKTSICAKFVLDRAPSLPLPHLRERVGVRVFLRSILPRPHRPLTLPAPPLGGEGWLAAGLTGPRSRPDGRRSSRALCKAAEPHYSITS